jgi:MYXO-CTERM domain-containing protein
MTRFFAFTSCILVALAVSAPAAADNPKGPAAAAKPAAGDPPWKVAQQREALFNEGVALMEKDDAKGALLKFREVQRLGPNPRVLIWMGTAEERLSHLLKARAIYQQAEADAHEAKLREDESDAKKLLEEIGHKIPRIAVRIIPPMSATVWIDSVRAHLKDGVVEVDVGSRTVSVTTEDHRSFSTEIYVRAGEDKVVDAVLSEPPPPQGGGCAGCTVGGNGAESLGVFAAGFALVLGRRRRRGRIT